MDTYTYVIDAAYYTPYLSITSPQRRCGKSRLLEVLVIVVNRPFLTGRTSVAALVRKIATDHSTLLLDESDAAFSGDRDYSQASGGTQKRPVAGSLKPARVGGHFKIGHC